MASQFKEYFSFMKKNLPSFAKKDYMIPALKIFFLHSILFIILSLLTFAVFSIFSSFDFFSMDSYSIGFMGIIFLEFMIFSSSYLFNLIVLLDEKIIKRTSENFKVLNTFKKVFFSAKFYRFATLFFILFGASVLLNLYFELWSSNPETLPEILLSTLSYLFIQALSFILFLLSIFLIPIFLVISYFSDYSLSRVISSSLDVIRKRIVYITISYLIYYTIKEIFYSILAVLIILVIFVASFSFSLLSSLWNPSGLLIIAALFLFLVILFILFLLYIIFVFPILFVLPYLDLKRFI